MRRLNEQDLNLRINKFMDRKTAQFPELGPAASRLSRDWNEKEEYTNKGSTVRWSLQLT